MAVELPPGYEENPIAQAIVELDARVAKLEEDKASKRRGEG